MSGLLAVVLLVGYVVVWVVVAAVMSGHYPWNDDDWYTTLARGLVAACWPVYVAFGALYLPFWCIGWLSRKAVRPRG